MKKVLLVIFTVFALSMFVSCSAEKEETQQNLENVQQSQESGSDANKNNIVADDAVFGEFDAVDFNGNSTLIKEAKEDLNEYAILQYYQLFDSKK